MIPNFIAFFRVLNVFSRIGSFVVHCFIRDLFWGHDLKWMLKRRQKLAKNLLRTLNVNLKTERVIHEGNVLYISNHRSYLDPVVLHKNYLFTPITKAEVSKWPIIGYACKITGVLFVQRENKSSRKETRQALVDTIQTKSSVCIYPEGTTHIEPQTLNFHKGAFVQAALYNLPVVPVALDYVDPSVAWIGDDTFLPHLFKLCKKDSIEVDLAIGPAILDTDHERLLKQTQTWIDLKLTRGKKYRETKDLVKKG